MRIHIGDGVGRSGEIPHVNRPKLDSSLYAMMNNCTRFAVRYGLAFHDDHWFFVGSKLYDQDPSLGKP